MIAVTAYPSDDLSSKRSKTHSVNSGMEAGIPGRLNHLVFLVK